MNNYETLLVEKEALTKRLAEVDSLIKSHEKFIYHGKMEKAIALLKECNLKMLDVRIFDIYQDCEGCGETINIELYLADIIERLEIAMECL